MGLKSIKKTIKKVSKGITKAPRQAAEKTLEGLLKPVKVILTLITRIIIILRTFIRQIFLYAKCFIKLLTNFYKCAFFYFLDIIKYLIMTVFLLFTVPIVALMSINNKKHNVKRYTQKVVYVFSKMTYGNKVMNDCYRCKKKKSIDISFTQKLKEFVGKELNPDLKKRKEPLSFYTILVWISILIIGIVFLKYYVVPGTFIHDTIDFITSTGQLIVDIGQMISQYIKGNENDNKIFKLWLLLICTIFLILTVNQKWTVLGVNTKYILLIIQTLIFFGGIIYFAFNFFSGRPDINTSIGTNHVFELVNNPQKYITEHISKTTTIDSSNNMRQFND
tara:strand:+ start:20 stop:1021 length:1002 start_codon:yes stop_codon:yes gene_type:complete